jgi:hypothetical protein
VKKSKNKLHNGHFIFRFIIALVLSIFLFLTLLIIPKYVNKVVNKTTKISDYNILAQNFLGFNGKKDILVLFMNNAEQRFGGGFIGSLGYLTADNGKIKSDPVREVYYYDYLFDKVKYIEKSNDPTEGDVLYSLRDSGQSLDWPSNAKRAKKIFELESGKKVDNVIGVTPEVLKYLIRETGPVYLKDYELTVNENNITETIQQEVEFGDDKKSGKDPKTILTSLFSVLMDRVAEKNVNELTQLASGLDELIMSRQIIGYSSDYESSEVLNRLKLDGSLVNSSADYFLMSEKNLSIDKSNAFIDRSLFRNIKVSEDGSVEVYAKIIRNQTVPVSLPYIDPNVPGVLTNIIRKNVSLIKVAVPKKSQIIDTEGSTKLEYRGTEGGYDIYAFQSSLEPLVPSEYNFKYKLPFKVVGNENYQIDSYIQIANGGWPYELREEIEVPKNWKYVSSNKKADIAGDKIRYNEKVNKDIDLKFIYEKK